LLTNGGARADGPTVAEVLFREARQAIRDGNYKKACPLLAESQRLDPSIGTLLNLGACEEHEGRIATAWVAFRNLLDTAPEGDERAAVAKAHVTALEPRLSWLRLHVQAPPSQRYTVLLDATSLGSASIDVALAVDPGTHVIVLDAPPRAQQSLTIVLREGQREERTLEVPTLAPPAPASEGSTNDRPPSVTPRFPYRTLGASAAGVGVGGLVVGAVLAGLAASKNNQSNVSTLPGGGCSGNACPPAALGYRQDARSLGNAATAATIFGTSLVVAGAAVWIIGWTGRSPQVPRAGIGIAGAGLLAQGEF
jgi:hypothetical protein